MKTITKKYSSEIRYFIKEISSDGLLKTPVISYSHDCPFEDYHGYDSLEKAKSAIDSINLSEIEENDFYARIYDNLVILPICQTKISDVHDIND